MKFIATSQEINKNITLKSMFSRLQQIAVDKEGYCYYKYPLAGGADKYLPGLSILDRERGILVIDALEIRLNSISAINENGWQVDGNITDSPLERLLDYKYNLVPRYEKYRELRSKIAFNGIILLPLIEELKFKAKFPDFDCSAIIFGDSYLQVTYEDLWRESKVLTENEWKLFVSISQGANCLTSYNPIMPAAPSNNIGKAIQLANERLAILDTDQHRAAIEIADGAQAVRGLAGSGKTIVLAMKAAYFHQKFPDRKVLYTFNTQSLYGFVKRLITRFYRLSEDHDPNWDNLHILHAWGGKTKEGVYYRTCIRNNIDPLTFRDVKKLTSGSFLDYVCGLLLDKPLIEEYDFVVIDEGQDFDPNFYKLVYKITKLPKRIVFAYDELQSLDKPKTFDTGELFGYAANGSKLVNLEGSYENGIEKIYELKKSYRNPLEILMAAHGIGLGIYNLDGPLQMIDSKELWDSIGYGIELGDLVKGQETTIIRPEENSPCPIKDCYSGEKKLIDFLSFKSISEQIRWVADSVYNDIKVENVPPHEIVVISLNPERIQSDFIPLQRLLADKGINSIIPGITYELDKFNEEGCVTFSTVYKAKGNEAAVVYVINFDFLYDYAEEISARNMAFTSISRAKGWCRIVGVGTQMERAIRELEKVINNKPRFNFTFPDMQMIKQLSSEMYARRAQEKKIVMELINKLKKEGDQAVMNFLSEEDKKTLRKKFGL